MMSQAGSYHDAGDNYGGGVMLIRVMVELSFAE